jgi:hypothetical protein
VTKELNGLKNKTTEATKKIKESECMVDDDISEGDCRIPLVDFTVLRSTYQDQERHGLAYDDY